MQLTCPHCATEFPLQDAEPGDPYDCLSCGRRFRVPAETGRRLPTYDLRSEGESAELPPTRQRRVPRAERESVKDRPRRKKRVAKRPWWDPVPEDYGPYMVWIGWTFAAGIPLYLIGWVSWVVSLLLMIAAAIVGMCGMMRCWNVAREVGISPNVERIALLGCSVPFLLLVLACLYPREAGKHFLFCFVGMFWCLAGFGLLKMHENAHHAKLLQQMQNPKANPGNPREDGVVAPAGPPIPLFSAGQRHYLADLEPFEFKSGHWEFTRDGTVGYPKGAKIVVGGTTWPRGLGGMHPPANGFSAAKYRINKLAAVFKSKVGIHEHPFPVGGVADFEVLGDGGSLWRSGAVDRGATRECLVHVNGVEILELRVHAPGSNAGVQAVWLNPRLLKSADSPDP